MTTEQHTKANEIREQIARLEGHKKEVLGCHARMGGYKPMLRSTTGGGAIDLKGRHCGVPFDMFMQLYILTIDREIDTLKTEFNAL